MPVFAFPLGGVLIGKGRCWGIAMRLLSLFAVLPLLGCFVLLCHADDDAFAKGGAFMELVSTLERELQSIDPQIPAIDVSDHGEASLQFRERVYTINVATKSGFGPPRQMNGPAANGFALYLGRCAPYAPSSSRVSLDRVALTNQYWSEYTNTFSINDTEQHFVLEYQFGANTDPLILQTILKVLRRDADEWPVGKDNVLTTADDRRKIEDNIDKILKKMPAVKTAKGNRTTWGYSVRDYHIHTVDDGGLVSNDAKIVAGPDSKGLIVSLNWNAALDASRPGAMQYGRTSHLYWESYSAFYGYKGLSLHLELMYGRRVDVAVLDKIVGAIENHLQKPGKFLR